MQAVVRHVLGVSSAFCFLAFQALAQQPSASVTQHEQAAHTFLQQQKPSLAIPEFEAVLSSDPNNLDAQANLGVLLFFAGKSQEAEPHLHAALSLAPNEPKLRALLGSCEHRTGQLEAARKDLTAAFAGLKEEKIRRQTGLEIVEVDTALNDLSAATDVLTQLRATLPTDPEVLFAAYRVYTDLAQESLLDLSVAAPNSAQMHQAMAHELVRDRDITGAAASLRAALRVNPNLPGGHFELAEVLRNSTDPKQQAEAEAEYKLALEQNPQDASALTRLGNIAADRNDQATATADYKQALAQQPNNEDAEIGLAHELSEGGQPEAALPLLQHVLQENPTNIVAHFRLSAVYRKLHQPDQARQQIAEYERLKAEKEKLHTLYQTMRLDTPQVDNVQP